MAAWWYALNNEAKGPVEQDEILRLLKSGTIGPSTRVWRKGLADWQPLAQVEDFRHMGPTPPPLSRETRPWARAEGSGPASSTGTKREMVPCPPQERVWARFFARSFDMFWEGLLVLAALSILFSLVFSGFNFLTLRFWPSLLFGLLAGFLSLFVDAWVYDFFGNTPGKAMLGLRVNRPDGEPMTRTDYAVRNILVWIMGTALNIMLLNIVAPLIQFNRLKKGRPASYDQDEEYQVFHHPISNSELAVFIVVYIVSVVVLSVVFAFLMAWASRF